MTDVQPTRKRCPRCDAEKDLSEFRRDAGRKLGVYSYCRPCESSYSRALAAHPEAKAKRAAYNHSRLDIEREPRRLRALEYYRSDPEKFKQRRRAAYAKNRRAQIDAVRDWQRRNIEQVRAARRAYIDAHPEYHANHRNRRRARMRAAGVHVVSLRDWLRLCARYDNRCAYCGADAPLTQEHVVPISRGGHHAIGNLLPACKPCNASKNNKLLVEWRALRN